MKISENSFDLILVIFAVMHLLYKEIKFKPNLVIFQLNRMSISGR